MISFSHKGNFSKTDKFFKKAKEASKQQILQKYGDMGVNALRSATPVDSGLTASSWYYTIESQNGITKLNFCNSNVNQNVVIAVILQYGHGTGTGGWVEGRDYINPAIQPVFDTIVNDIWKEVTNL